MRNDARTDNPFAEPETPITVNGSSPAKEKEAKTAKNQTTKLLEIAGTAELFHFGDDCFASVPVGNHLETWPINGKGFRRWLGFRYFEREGKAASAGAIQETLEVLSGKAQFHGVEHTVYARVGGTDQRIFLDLGNDSWEVVEITETGWRTYSIPPLKFKRPRGLAPLPTPLPGGSIEDLKPFVNINPTDWPLLTGWLVGALRPAGPFTPLGLNGEQGAAKTTTTRVLKALIDPNTAPLRQEPRDPRDLIISATNSWVLALDNLSHLPNWLSDALCRLSTGGGFSTRELYSNDEEKLFEARRPIILNGIEELATRGDLLDRSIILHLPSIAENKRLPEDAFWKQFENKRPYILGALLDAVSVAIRNLPTVTLPSYPRMADFTKWVTAAAPAFGWSQDTFLEAYSSNRQEANHLSLGASPITEPLLNFIPCGSWQGTPSELLQGLSDHSANLSRVLPSSPMALSGMLRRLAPNLRRIGLSVTFPPRTGTRRLIKLEKTAETASQASQPSPTPDVNLDFSTSDAHDAPIQTNSGSEQ